VKQLYRENRCCKAASRNVITDVYDEIQDRGYLNVGWSGFSVDKFVGVDSAGNPSGYFGDILKAITIAIFGEYSSERVNLITTGSNSRWEKSYTGETDLGMYFPSMKNDRSTSLEFLVNGSTVRAGFPFAGPMMSVKSAWKINPLYHQNTDCDLDCQESATVKSSLRNAMLKKKELHPSSTEFIIAAFTGCTADFLNRRMVLEWADELSSTGLTLKYGHTLSSIITETDVGNYELLYVNGPNTGSPQNVSVDAYSTDDWYIQWIAEAYIGISELDVKQYPFLAFGEPYGIILPLGKVTQRLNAAVTVALTCLDRASKYNIHSEADLNAASPAAKAVFFQTFEGFANNKPVCSNIVSKVGSLKNLTDSVLASSDIPGYEITTTDIFSQSL
jgi:hypothetical protein